MKLAPIFSNDMVFAAGRPIYVFGHGSGKAVAKFCGSSVAGEFSGDGKWMLELPAQDFGGPYELEVDLNGEKVIFTGIYVGKVYLLSGQSNAEFKMSESNYPASEYKSDDLLRIFTVDRLEVNKEAFNAADGWIKCDKATVGGWSALAYHVGRMIRQRDGVAVGMIACYQGASIIETWVPEGTYQSLGINIPIEEKHLDHSYPLYQPWNRDAILYDYMFSTIIPYGISNVIWYQGESDTTVAEGKVYDTELAELIKIWRRDLKNADLRFIIVQIANFDPRMDEGWFEVQRAQERVAGMISGICVVKCSDICESCEIHPKTKDKLAARIVDNL